MLLCNIGVNIIILVHMLLCNIGVNIIILVVTVQIVM